MCGAMLVVPAALLLLVSASAVTGCDDDICAMIPNLCPPDEVCTLDEICLYFCYQPCVGDACSSSPAPSPTPTEVPGSTCPPGFLCENGYCDTVDGDFGVRCVCFEGWTGEDCGQTAVTCSPECEAGQLCQLLQGVTPVCVLDTTTTTTPAAHCDFNYCTDVPGMCAPGTTCEFNHTDCTYLCLTPTTTTVATIEDPPECGVNVCEMFPLCPESMDCVLKADCTHRCVCTAATPPDLCPDTTTTTEPTTTPTTTITETPQVCKNRNCTDGLVCVVLSDLSEECQDLHNPCNDNFQPRSDYERLCVGGLFCNYGRCIDDGIISKCECDKGASGFMCESKCCLECQKGRCNTFPNGTMYCNCFHNYTGDACDVAIVLRKSKSVGGWGGPLRNILQIEAVCRQCKQTKISMLPLPLFTVSIRRMLF